MFSIHLGTCSGTEVSQRMYTATQSTQTIRLHKTFLSQEFFEVFENRQREDRKGNGEDIRGSRGAELNLRCET